MANLLKTLATTVISTSNMVTTIATRSDRIIDNSLGMLEDISANGKDYTAMAKLSDMTRRRQEFITENSDIKAIPPALQAILDLEVKEPISLP